MKKAILPNNTCISLWFIVLNLSDSDEEGRPGTFQAYRLDWFELVYEEKVQEI